MTSLVLELQRDALDKGISVSDLLRKALVVSRKLGVDSIQEWLGNELNGYGPGDSIPNYREIKGQIKCFNPYNGWIPLHFDDPAITKRLSKRKVNQAIGQLDNILENQEGSLTMPFDHDTAAKLMNRMDVPLEPSLHIASVSIFGILDAARNQVLEWSLQLEAEGVIGEGMTFTAEEKKAAQSVTYNVTNIGTMTNSQLQQGNTDSSQSAEFGADLNTIRQVLAELRSNIDSLELGANESQQLVVDIDTVIAQSKSPKPSVSIVSESLRSIRTILEGAAASVIGNQALQQIGRWIVGG